MATSSWRERLQESGEDGEWVLNTVKHGALTSTTVGGYSTFRPGRKKNVKLNVSAWKLAFRPLLLVFSAQRWIRYRSHLVDWKAHLYVNISFSRHYFSFTSFSRQFDLLRNSARDLITDRNEKKLMNMFFNYMNDYWIDSTSWPPSSWSVFMQKVKYKIINNKKK